MSATEGVIIQKSQAIGIKKALQKMVDYLVKEVKDADKKRIVITHCNCPQRAEFVKELLAAKIGIKELVVMDTAGISSMYANDGGVIVTV